METPHPLFKLPPDAQATLFLIKQELKTRKLFHLLREIGVSESSYESNLDSLILRHVAMDDGTDDTFARYDAILEKRTRKCKGTEKSFMKQAFKTYLDLTRESRT